MSDVEIINAKIESTMLGIEDHGILSFFLHCSGDGWGQGFGGYALDGYDKKLDRRVGVAFGTEVILNILRTLEVDTWEELPGKHIRIKRDRDWEKIHAIGHITKNKWFDIQELADKHFTQKKQSQ